ncbi:class I SAM-dependent methyltransferase [bacterium]|nr:class I SAM-dependent methyltransferase [bacterium]
MNRTEYASIFALEETHWWYRGLRDLVEAQVRRLGRSDLRMLDAGCGTGGMMARLAKYGAVDGIDYADEAVAFCRERGLEGARQGDLNDCALPRETYDVIVSLDVLYHRAINDDGAVLARLASALKPGGTMILNLAAFECLRRGHDIAVETKRRYRAGEVRRMVAAAGLEARVVTYRLPLLFPAAYAAKMIGRARGRAAMAASDLRMPPRPVNRLLRALAGAENALICRGVALPFGTSVFTVAYKPSQ